MPFKPIYLFIVVAYEIKACSHPPLSTILNSKTKVPIQCYQCQGNGSGYQIKLHNEINPHCSKTRSTHHLSKRWWMAQCVHEKWAHNSRSKGHQYLRESSGFIAIGEVDERSQGYNKGTKSIHLLLQSQFLKGSAYLALISYIWSLCQHSSKAHCIAPWQ